MGNSIPKYELEILKLFLLELKNNQAVECVYLVPTFRKIEYGRESFDYFFKEFYIIARKGTIQFEQLQKSVNKTRFSLKEEGYFFVDEYDFHNIENFDKWDWKSLVSSYIIFDRNGCYERLQDELKTKIKPYNTLLVEIENIDELNAEPIKKRALIRNS